MLHWFRIVIRMGFLISFHIDHIDKEIYNFWEGNSWWSSNTAKPESYRILCGLQLHCCSSLQFSSCNIPQHSEQNLTLRFKVRSIFEMMKSGVNLQCNHCRIVGSLMQTKQRQGILYGYTAHVESQSSIRVSNHRVFCKNLFQKVTTCY